MRPVSYKPKTGRRFRGLEVAQAAILLVLGVAAALTLYFIMMGMIQSTPVPDVQLDPYNSYTTRINVAQINLIFGKSLTVVRVWVDNSKNRHIAECNTDPSTGLSSLPLTVVPGQVHTFTCVLDSGANWDDSMIVRVKFDDGHVASLRWVR